MAELPACPRPAAPPRQTGADFDWTAFSPQRSAVVSPTIRDNFTPELGSAARWLNFQPKSSKEAEMVGRKNFMAEFWLNFVKSG